MEYRLWDVLKSALQVFVIVISVNQGHVCMIILLENLCNTMDILCPAQSDK